MDCMVAGNSATKICQRGPSPGTRQTMADVQTYFQDLCVMASTGFRLPALMSDWTHLFLADDNIEETKNLHRKLMNDLQKTGKDIWAANQQRTAKKSNKQQRNAKKSNEKQRKAKKSN